MCITILGLAEIQITYFARRHASIFGLGSKLDISHVVQIFTNENWFNPLWCPDWLQNITYFIFDIFIKPPRAALCVRSDGIPGIDGRRETASWESRLEKRDGGDAGVDFSYIAVRAIS